MPQTEEVEAVNRGSRQMGTADERAHQLVMEVSGHGSGEGGGPRLMWLQAPDLSSVRVWKEALTPLRQASFGLQLIQQVGLKLTFLSSKLTFLSSNLTFLGLPCPALEKRPSHASACMWRHVVLRVVLRSTLLCIAHSL